MEESVLYKWLDESLEREITVYKDIHRWSIQLREGNIYFRAVGQDLSDASLSAVGQGIPEIKRLLEDLAADEKTGP